MHAAAIGPVGHHLEHEPSVLELRSCFSVVGAVGC